MIPLNLKRKSQKIEVDGLDNGRIIRTLSLEKDCLLLFSSIAANSHASMGSKRPHTDVALCSSMRVATIFSFMARSTKQADNKKQVACWKIEGTMQDR